MSRPRRHHKGDSDDFTMELSVMPAGRHLPTILLSLAPCVLEPLQTC